jgi:hypothetical protein
MTRRDATAGLLGLLGVLSLSGQAPYPEQGEWRQWGGPQRNFHVKAGPLAETWPDSGPPVLWERALGLGHSAIVVDDGRLFTLYRPGKQVSRKGPWEAREIVVALDAVTGKTLWEHEYPSEPLTFSLAQGPMQHRSSSARSSLPPGPTSRSTRSTSGPARSCGCATS